MTGCSCDLLINIALTLLGYIPGHLHAVRHPFEGHASM